MSSPEQILEIPQNNDVNLTFLVTDPDNGNQPFDLTGYSAAFIRKGNRFLPDSDPSFKSYVAIVDPDQVANKGKAVATVPAADNSQAGIAWARLDVSKSGKVRTANSWILSVTAE